MNDKIKLLIKTKKATFEDIEKKVVSTIKFKEGLDIGDIVIIIIKEVPVYGKIIDIVPDKIKKGGWWHITFYLLVLPLTKMTWILRDAQMTGKEVFTINGEKRFFAPVNFEDSKRFEPKKSMLKIV